MSKSMSVDVRTSSRARLTITGAARRADDAIDKDTSYEGIAIKEDVPGCLHAHVPIASFSHVLAEVNSWVNRLATVAGIKKVVAHP